MEGIDLGKNKPRYTERVVILQTGNQIKHYRSNNRCEHDIVIPIGPEAMFAAQNNGWKICNLGELWQGRDYEKSLEESQSRIDRLIDNLNKYSKEWNPGIGLEIGNYFAFQLWVIIGQIHYNYFIARSIQLKFQPESILVYTKDFNQPFLEFRPDPDCVFADILLQSGCFKAGVIKMQRIRENKSGNTVKEKILNVLPPKLVSALKSFRIQRQIKSSPKTLYSLLLVGAAYDWMKISQFEEFRKEFSIDIMQRISVKEKQAPPDELIDIINSSIYFSGNTVFNLKNIASAIYSDLLLFAEREKEVKTELTKYNAVITAVFTSPWESYVAHMAVTLAKPVLVWQHGEKGQTWDVTVPYTELFYASDYLAYGPAVEKQYREWIGKSRLLVVETVGSIGKKVAWYGGNKIIYATGKWFKTATPFGPQDPDRRLFDAHRHILDYLDKLKGHHVIFKANNTPGFSGVPYAYSYVQINYYTPFTELLKTAGIIILDTPGTTLVEACSTLVPIFALAGRNEYLPDFLEKIKRRVVWCETPDELIKKIEAYLLNGQYGADVNDNSYYTEYCASISQEETIIKVKKSLLNAIQRCTGTHVFEIEATKINSQLINTLEQ